LFLDPIFFLSLSIFHQLCAAFLLAIPAMVDWTTQAWRLRVSTNRFRLITGFSEGVGISLLTIVAIPFAYKFLLVLLVAGSTAGLGFMASGRGEETFSSRGAF
jgi:uncharacterized membrane protein